MRLLLCHKRQNPESENEFVQLLISDIETCLEMMENSSDKHFCAREDDITSELVGNLVCLGYDASEQTKKNGAVDLTVKHLNYKWIAEAKRGSTNLKIFEGFLQLLTRYIKRDRNAGILIYYQKENSINEFKGLVNFFGEKKWLESKSLKKDLLKLNIIAAIFNTVRIENIKDTSFDLFVTIPSGQEVKIRVMCANFHFDPVDCSGRNAQRIHTENAKIYLMNLFHSWRESDYENFEKCLLDDALERLYKFENGDYDL